MSADNRGRYIGLDRGASAIARHNRTVPADAQGDACTCPTCGDLSAQGKGDHKSPRTEAEFRRLHLTESYPPSPHAARGADPAAAVLACPADVQRPVARGPVQDESKLCDPLDRRAAREVEGHSFLTDGDA